MKLVKKILRLLPIIYILFVFLCIIFSYNQTMEYQNFNYFLDNIDINSGTWDAFFDLNYYSLIPTDLYNWFSSNISGNYLYLMCVGILFYELYLSIAFIMFDFINMVFDWANKFIKKGSDSIE